MDPGAGTNVDLQTNIHSERRGRMKNFTRKLVVLE